MSSSLEDKWSKNRRNGSHCQLVSPSTAPDLSVLRSQTCSLSHGGGSEEEEENANSGSSDLTVFRRDILTRLVQDETV